MCNETTRLSKLRYPVIIQALLKYMSKFKENILLNKCEIAVEIKLNVYLSYLNDLTEFTVILDTCLNNNYYFLKIKHIYIYDLKA